MTSPAAPHTHPAALYLLLLLLIRLPVPPSLHLILPEEFNLLPRVPSHNFFKSTFYETAIPFHRGPLYSKSYLRSVICGHINMTKVPVCSPALCSSPVLSPAEAFYRIAECQLASIREAVVSIGREIKAARPHKQQSTPNMNQ